jgi:hypothetical protein
VITGARTEFCVDATCRRADGHTTSDNNILPPAQVIAHHHRALSQLATDGPRVTVRTASALAVGRHLPTFGRAGDQLAAFR